MPRNVRWRHGVAAGLLGNIGLTMSAFKTNLAFVGPAALVASSKMAMFLASLKAGAAG
ncbi:Na+/H+ antiporter NhaA [Massilia sp. DWR3-1-1]|uniref:Na+/H+ antiporter NhaA n=1 Tax=Massilia sp. DWR3-1-1 TaxID=2804559 RepID=UPI003CF15311